MAKEIKLILPDWLEIEPLRPGINKAIVRKNIIFPKIAEALGYKLDAKKQAFGLTVQQVLAMKRALRKWLVERLGCNAIYFTGKSQRADVAIRNIQDPDERAAAAKKAINRSWAIKESETGNNNFRKDVKQGPVVKLRDICDIVRVFLDGELS